MRGHSPSLCYFDCMTSLRPVATLASGEQLFTPTSPIHIYPHQPVRPSRIEKDGHEALLVPETESGPGRPRLARPELDAAANRFIVDVDEIAPANAHHAVHWVGGGRGVVARTPWGEPVVRAVAYAAHEDDRKLRLWVIGDGALSEDESEVQPLRLTVAVSPALETALTEDPRYMGWVAEKIANPSELLEPGAVLPTGLFGPALSLAHLSDERLYPDRLRELLEPFKKDGRTDDAIEREDEHYAALMLRLILLRSFRPNGDSRSPYELLGEVCAEVPGYPRSVSWVRDQVAEAMRRDVVGKAAPGTGARELTEKGDWLLGDLVSDWGSR